MASGQQRLTKEGVNNLNKLYTLKQEVIQKAHKKPSEMIKVKDELAANDTEVNEINQGTRKEAMA